VALLPLAFGAWEIALAFSAANLAVLAWRLRIENAALTRRRAL
jgi:methyltransferase